MQPVSYMKHLLSARPSGPQVTRLALQTAVLDQDSRASRDTAHGNAKKGTGGGRERTVVSDRTRGATGRPTGAAGKANKVLAQ